MKKVLFYFCVMLLLGTTLSSCLGDSESYYDSKSYGVISEVNGVKVAKVILFGNTAYSLSSPSISGYTTGDIMLMNYRVDFTNVNSSLVVPAQSLDIVEGNVYTTTEQKIVERGTVPEAWDQNPLVLFSTTLFDTSGYYLNRSVFAYSYAKKTGQEVELEFFYDADNQADAEDSSNTYIIDVRMNILAEGTGTQTVTVSDGVCVNFTSFKDFISPSVVAADGEYINIWFRYYKQGSAEGVYTIDKNASNRIWFAQKA